MILYCDVKGCADIYLFVVKVWEPDLVQKPGP